MTQPKIRTLRLVNFSQQLVSSTVKHKVTVEFTWIVPRIFNHHPKWQVPRPTWIRMGTWYTYRCSQNVYVLYVLCMHIHVSPWCGLCKHVWTNTPLNLSFPRWRDFLLCFSGSLCGILGNFEKISASPGKAKQRAIWVIAFKSSLQTKDIHGKVGCCLTSCSSDSSG